jgi:phage terminase large subunit
MKQLVNKVYKDLFVKKPRYIVLMGGRGAGRSTVASQFANAKLVAPEYFRCAIMRYILGDIRNSIYREILDRADENEVLDKLTINESTMTISYGENTINAVGFRKSSGDQKSKLKSLANYNCVIIEEADEIPEEDFMQLDDSLRTVKGDITIILLLNPPPKTHWIIKRWFDLIPSEQKDFYIPKLKAERTDTVCIRSSYLDNIKNIAPASVAQYELYKETKPEHYWNMIKGLVPETVKGKIYKEWKIISHIPHEARLERYGIDFGFTVDPTAVVAIYRYNGGFILDEILYKTGMLNKQIADYLLSLPNALCVADSAEPKSIVELNTYGLQVVGAKKGADSVRFGIATVQQQRVSVTERSRNIWNEYDNHAWMVDKDGNSLNVPKPGLDHMMSAIRYAVKNIIPDDTIPKKQFSGQNILDQLMQEDY